MRERGYTLTRPDLARVRGAVRHVETLSREGVNVTPLPGVAMLATAETVCRAVEITDEPPSGSPDLSVMYRGVIFFREGDAWQQASVLVRPVLDDVRLLKVGMTTLAYLVGEYTGDGDYQGQLVFSAAQTPAGCGLKYVESEEFPTFTSVAVDLDAIAGDGLEVDEGEEGECPKLKVISTGVVETLGCGLSRAGGTLHVDLTEAALDGLYFNAEICALGVNYGCGLTITSDPEEGDQLVVDVAALAGDNTLSSLVVVPGGASCDSLGVDLEEAFTDPLGTFITSVTPTVAGGKLRLTMGRAVVTRHYNAAGLQLDTTAEAASPTVVDLDICPIVECCTAEELAVECTRSTSSAETGEVINFTSTPSGGKEPYTYDWDWDDGTTHGTAQNPTHAYSAAGTYTPILTVYDACGKFVLCYPGTITVTSDAIYTCIPSDPETYTYWFDVPAAVITHAATCAGYVFAARDSWEMIYRDGAWQTVEDFEPFNDCGPLASILWCDNINSKWVLEIVVDTVPAVRYERAFGLGWLPLGSNVMTLVTDDDPCCPAWPATLTVYYVAP